MIDAVTDTEMASLWKLSREWQVPCHMHVSEQAKEVEQCTAHYGDSPLTVVLNACQEGGNVDVSLLTAVHCNLASADERCRLTENGGKICVTPLTEASFSLRINLSCDSLNLFRARRNCFFWRVVCK